VSTRPSKAWVTPLSRTQTFGDLTKPSPTLQCHGAGRRTSNRSTIRSGYLATVLPSTASPRASAAAAPGRRDIPVGVDGGESIVPADELRPPMIPALFPDWPTTPWVCARFRLLAILLV